MAEDELFDDLRKYKIAKQAEQDCGGGGEVINTCVINKQEQLLWRTHRVINKCSINMCGLVCVAASE